MELILNHVSGQVLKELVKQPMKKKAKASKTRLPALTKDGMLFRIINIICSTEGRALFLHTKRVLSCASLDSGEKSMSLYEGMLDLLRDMLEYNMIDVLDQSQMVGYGVEDDPAMDFDEFWEACNNKNKSGSHQPFVDYTSRKPYLLYLHLQSAEIGDKAFPDCAYFALLSEAAFSSSVDTSLLTDDTTNEKSLNASNKGREQSSTKNDGNTSRSPKFIHCYQRSERRAGEVEAGERSTSCISVNFLCQKYEKMKKQVGYESE